MVLSHCTGKKKKTEAQAGLMTHQSPGNKDMAKPRSEPVIFLFVYCWQCWGNGLRAPFMLSKHPVTGLCPQFRASSVPAYQYASMSLTVRGRSPNACMAVEHSAATLPPL